MSPSYRLSYTVDKEGKENRKPHTSKIISFLVFKWCDEKKPRGSSLPQPEHGPVVELINMFTIPSAVSKILHLLKIAPSSHVQQAYGMAPCARKQY